MHVAGFLHKLMSSAIHKTRIIALSKVVESAIDTKILRLTALGRGIEHIQERSGIQKVNRLLGNKYLLDEKILISKHIAELLIGYKKHPNIIVDWTKYPNSEDAVLRAALAVEGRALTIYEERHPVKKMGNRAIQKKFLIALKRLLPDCRAIIITDAGFHNVWFKEVLNQGWDYIGRIRGLKKYSIEGKTFYRCKSLFKRATPHIKYLGPVILTIKNSFKTNFYIVKGKLQGRKARTKSGKVKIDKDSRNYSRSHREPWLLASSLKGRGIAKKIERIYKRRATIEEAFRDLKSSRYGLSLSEGRTRKKSRRDILLLIGMLASLIAWITGKIGEERKIHYQFQSNSIKHRRVISLFYLGCQMIRKKVSISIGSFWDAIDSLREESIYE